MGCRNGLTRRSVPHRILPHHQAPRTPPHFAACRVHHSRTSPGISVGSSRHNPMGLGSRVLHWYVSQGRQPDMKQRADHANGEQCHAAIMDGLLKCSAHLRSSPHYHPRSALAVRRSPQSTCRSTVNCGRTDLREMARRPAPLCRCKALVLSFLWLVFSHVATVTP